MKLGILIIEVVLLVIFVPGTVFLIFFLFGEAQRLSSKNLKCLHGKKPHLWSLWKPVMPCSLDICSERYCYECGTVEKNHIHELEVFNVDRAGCEPVIEHCKVCGFVKKTNSGIEHDFENDNGFETLFCLRCKKEYLLV